MNESYNVEPHKRPKMNGREVPFNPITGEGIAYPTGGKPIPEYAIEEKIKELPPAPGKPSHPKPPKFTGFSGTPVQRNDWDDRFWRQFGKAVNYNPLTRWALNTEQLPESAQTDSGLENIAELIPNPYTAIATGYDDIVSSESLPSMAFETAALAAPLARGRFPRTSFNVQATDFADDMENDVVDRSKEGKHNTFWPWDQYEYDVEDYNKKFTK